jgi:hypothetical protein
MQNYQQTIKEVTEEAGVSISFGNMTSLSEIYAKTLDC